MLNFNLRSCIPPNVEDALNLSVPNTLYAFTWLKLRALYRRRKTIDQPL